MIAEGVLHYGYVITVCVAMFVAIIGVYALMIRFQNGVGKRQEDLRQAMVSQRECEIVTSTNEREHTALNARIDTAFEVSATSIGELKADMNRGFADLKATIERRM